MENELLKKRKAALKKKQLPKHIAIIMDGNGRWAKQRNLKRIDGHRAGIDTVRRIVRFAGELGIGYMTLYTFSSENWNRPPGEVLGIMKLLAETLEKEIPELNKNHVSLRTIGDISALPGKSRNALIEAVRLTAANDGLTLILALNYGGRNEIVRTVRSIAERIETGSLTSKDITPDVIESSLDTAGIPDPDLLIRTSGEYRLSNFLLWQLAYTELWLTNGFWPDFSEFDFLDALESYALRERRFGMTSQQIVRLTRKVKDFFLKGDR
ncbi:isoprenyl transferase [Candidatus Latescibacterota bacterium]